MANKQSKFGEILISSVRDNTCFVLEGIINGNMKSPSDKALHDKIKLLSKKQIELLRLVSTKMIDLSLHNMLVMFEENDDWVISNQEGGIDNLNDISDGLAGELYSDEGWIKKFSKYPSTL